jgi:1-acyl-sn-glycerol-3-phosphate acyltransferase
MEKYKGLFYWFWAGIAGFILKKWGFVIINEFPEIDKLIIVVAPHRESWRDVLLGWCIKEIKPIPPKKFLVKWEAYYSWAWPFLWWQGGVPIDRKRDKNSNVPKGAYVDQIVEVLEKKKKIGYVVTPEGTRDKGAHWKRGFYSAAVRTGEPVVFVGFDYVNKRAVIGPKVYFTGDVEHDLNIINTWYTENVPGYQPVLNIEVFEKN